MALTSSAVTSSDAIYSDYRSSPGESVGAPVRKPVVRSAKQSVYSLSILRGPSDRFDLAELTPYERSYSSRLSQVTLRVEALLSWLQSVPVAFPCAADVRDYVLRHEDMVDLVASACQIASTRFGKTSRLYLEVYHDPEIEDEYLTLYIRQKEYDATFLDQIGAVRAEYEENLAGKSGWFLVTTDFRPAR